MSLACAQTLCQQLAEALEHGFTKNGQQDAYTYLSVALPAMWVSMGTSLAPIMAAHIIETGGMPLLLRAARVCDIRTHTHTRARAIEGNEHLCSASCKGRRHAQSMRACMARRA